MSAYKYQTFNPANYHFSWTDDGWYAWDRKAAHSAALKARNAEAKRLQAQARPGQRVVKTAVRDQMITRGGIGSGHPEISMHVTVYMVEMVGVAV